MSEKTARRGVSIFIDGKEVKNSVSGINAELRKLQGEQKKMTLGSDEYIAHTKKIAYLKSIMTEHQLEQRKVTDQYLEMSGAAKRYGTDGESVFGRLANGFNKYFAMTTAFLASITGISLAFRKLAEDVAKMDDTYSDVMKTTGMTRDEVLALNEELKKIDTRSSREQLNMLARDAGKLGISAKKDVLDFVEAGNMINVALGEDLGDDAIKSIGKMVDVYKSSTEQIRDLDLKEQMLAVGSAVNELGASSTASERYLVEFAGRLGGVSKQAKISMADILGFASSLDQDMQAVEMSATAFQNFIMKLMGDPAKFARLAGIEVRQFTELLETDTNKAIKDVLRALNEKGGFQQLIPIFQEMGLDGARAVGVLSAMSGSINKIDEAQKVANQSMAEGTSITNEYTIKNNNLAAQLDKARKAFFETALELGESLNPILLKSTKATTYLIKALVELPKWLKENKGLIFTLFYVIGIYTLYVQRARLATLANIAAEKLNIVWKKASTAATLLQVAAVGYFTGATRAANLATKAFFATLGLNPFVAIGVLLGALTIGLYKFATSNKAATDSVKAANAVNQEAINNTREEVRELKQLHVVLKSSKMSYDDKKKALDEIKARVPEYHASLTEEGVLINDNSQALDGYIQRLLLSQKIKIANAKLGEAESQMAAFIEKYQSELSDLAMATAKAQEQVELGLVESVDVALSSMGYGGAGTRALKAMKKTFDDNIKVFERMVDGYKQELSAIPQMANDVVETVETFAETKVEIEEGSYKKSLENLEENHKIQQLALMQFYNDQLVNQELYEKMLSQQQINFLEHKIKIQKKFNQSSVDTELELLRERDKIRKEDLKREEDHRKALESMTIKEAFKTGESEEIDYTEYTLAMRLKLLDAFHEKGLISEQEYINQVAELLKGNQKEINKHLFAAEMAHNNELFQKGLIGRKQYLENQQQLTKRYYEEMFADVLDFSNKFIEVMASASQFVQSLQEAEMIAVENKYSKQLQLAKKHGEDTTLIEEKIEKEKLEIKKKYADLEFIIKIANIYADTAVAAVKAVATLGFPAGALVAGLITASGHAQAYIAMQQRDAVKNLWTGGFTGPGGKYDPKGIVHAGEFVSNAEAVANPNLKPMFNLIDQAQRSGTVSSLTKDELTRALSPSAGTASAASAKTGQNTPATSTDTSVALLVMDAARSIARLNELLDGGIEAYSVISGPKGSSEMNKKYDDLIKNVSR